MKWLPWLLIVVPAVELFGLIAVGKWIGAWPTVALLLLSGLAGAWLVRLEARRVWRDARQQLEQGQVPASSLLDGICLLAAGLLLLTPGFSTDIVGLLLVFPISRTFFKVALGRWLQRRIADGRFTVYFRR